MLTKIGSLGYGGQWLDTILPKALVELQQITLSGPMVGAAPNTAILVPEGIDSQDTIVKLLGLKAGTLTDFTAEASITDLQAMGQLTLTGVVAGDVVAVNGFNYKFIAVVLTPSTNLPPFQVPVGSTDAQTAGYFAQAINGNDPTLKAKAVGNAVAVTANNEGVAGNTVALSVAGSNGHATDSGADLMGGSAANSIMVSVDTTGEQLLMLWFKKDRLLTQA